MKKKVTKKKVVKKGTKKKVRRRGKPPIKTIDFQIVKNLCALHCTSVEIAGAFEIDEDTLHTRIREEYALSFSEFFKRFSAKGKISLRRKLFNEAMKKENPKIMEFMAKHWLKMNDKISVVISEDEINEAIKKELEHMNEGN